MSMIQGILQELEMEAATTARVLDRVPNDKLAWKPHAKSMSLGQLAMHIATIPGAIASMAQLPEMPLPTLVQASVENAAQLRPLLDESMASARKWTTAILCVIVWYSFIAGHIVNNVRGLFGQ